MDNVIDKLKRQKGIERQQHFDAGGTLEEWRGKCVVIPDKKKEKNRKECRDIVKHHDD